MTMPKFSTNIALPIIKVGKVEWNGATGLCNRQNLDLAVRGAKAVYNMATDAGDWVVQKGRAVLG